MSRKIIENVVKYLYTTIMSAEFANNFKFRPQDFTRNRKLSFADNVILILNKTGKGLRTGIRTFLKTMKPNVENYSVQAFSKGRMRIRFEAFVELLRMTVKMFYYGGNFNRFKGFRVTAIDGMRTDLPYHEDTLEEFGCQKGTNNQIQALSSCLYDVLNNIIIDALIAPNDASENELAKRHIEYLCSISTGKELIIFDRGYPSSELMSFIESKGSKYLFRYNQTFLSGAKNQITSGDSIISYRFKSTGITLKMRVITITLPNGSQETLVTNIFDEFTKEDFKELYHMRWKIETNYDDLKNKLEIENFSGVSPLAIKQDFYATMVLKNLVSIMIYSNQEEINCIHNSSKNKYQYKANVNNVISILKTDLINMLTIQSEAKRRKLWNKIYSELTRAVVPIRPGRAFKRYKKHQSAKFHQNQRA